MCLPKLDGKGQTTKYSRIWFMHWAEIRTATKTGNLKGNIPSQPISKQQSFAPKTEKNSTEWNKKRFAHHFGAWKIQKTNYFFALFVRNHLVWAWIMYLKVCVGWYAVDFEVAGTLAATHRTHILTRCDTIPFHSVFHLRINSVPFHFSYSFSVSHNVRTNSFLVGNPLRLFQFK